MIPALRRWTAILCALTLFIPGDDLSAQTRRTVQAIQIRHVGPPAVSDELANANIRVKVGEAYEKANVDDDVRNLYGTGYFYNIQVSEEETKDNGVVLTYVLQGKPLLTDIRFEGNKKYSVAKIKKKITSRVGEPLNETKLFSDVQEIKKMYQKAGLQKTEVKATPVVTAATGRGTVTFEIKEAPKIKIEDVEFVGATAFKQKKLRKTIKTRRHWMFSWLTGSGVLKDDQLEEDREKLREFYQGEGYVDFELKDVQYEYTPNNRMVIKFTVFEGKQYKVGNVAFRGNKLFGTNDLARVLKMGSGKTFTPKALYKDHEAVVDYYGARGYIDAVIRPLKSANIETGTIDLTYDIEEADKSFVEKIEIKGNTITRDRVIRRELAISPGEVFDMVRVKMSTNILGQMQYFSKIDTEIEPTDVSNRRNLAITLEEASTGSFDIGAGFSTIDNLVGFVGLTQANFDLFNPPYFRGGGQRFRIRATIGTQRKDFVISFVEPWFLGRRLRFELDLYHRELSYLSDLYDQRQTGARLGLVKAITRDLAVGISYTIENIGIHNVSSEASDEFKMEQGDRLVSKVGPSIIYDTRNSVRLPNRGQRSAIETAVAGGPFGGDTDFYKIDFNTAWYYRGLWPSHIIEVSGQIGTVESYDNTTRVPLFDRWFLGGANTLRGYKYRFVGPKDANGEPIGGETYWFGSVEYSIPIIDRLRFAMFYDVGNVYRSSFSFNPNGLRDEPFYYDNWGLGIRLEIPQFGAPLRLDYGIPITHDKYTSDSGRFQFGIGYSKVF